MQKCYVHEQNCAYSQLFAVGLQANCSFLRNQFRAKKTLQQSSFAPHPKVYLITPTLPPKQTKALPYKEKPT